MPDSRNTATGYLVVAVTTAQNAVPLENALVTVSSVNENGDSELLYTTRTNRSGQTAMLPLPAPPLGNSLSPGSSNRTAVYHPHQPFRANRNAAPPCSTARQLLIPRQQQSVCPLCGYRKSGWLSAGFYQRPDGFRRCCRNTSGILNTA